METYSGLELQRSAGSLQSQLYGGNSLSTLDPYLQVYPPPQYNYHYHTSCLGCRPVQPHDLELIVELVGSETKLNYGARLRVLMADPVKGHDLRNALQKVQEAILAAFNS